MSGEARTLQGRFLRRLEQRPAGRALAFVGGRGKFEWESFGDFWRDSARHASILADAGLQPGDVCALVLSSDRFCALNLLATLILGARPVLVAPPIMRGLHSNLKDVVRHVVGKTKARVAVAGPGTDALARDLVEEGSETRFLIGEEAFQGGDADAAPIHCPAETDILGMQLTSGTTGFPRVCVWEQQRVIAALDGMIAAMKLSPEDVCVNWTPLYHDMGLVNNFFTCLASDIPLAMINPMDFLKRPSLWLKTLQSTGCTVTWSPNFGFAVTAQGVRDDEMEGVRLDGVKGFWNAAERVHYDTMVAFHRRFEPYGVTRRALKTNFGCAENVGGATFSDPDGDFLVEHVDRSRLHEGGVAEPVGEAADGSVAVVGVGRTCPGMKVHAMDENGEVLPDGRVGEVAFITPSRMLGYMDDEEQTARAIRGPYLYTGDVGYTRGEELFWVGRSQERINLHAKKYDPSDFEKPLFDVQGVRPGSFAAFGVDDAKQGTQRLIILAEVRKEDERSHDDILEEVKEKIMLQVGVRVGEVLLMPYGSMSKTSSGKRRHRFYRERFLADDLEPLARLRVD